MREGFSEQNSCPRQGSKLHAYAGGIKSVVRLECRVEDYYAQCSSPGPRIR